jgi:dGTPase
MRKVAAMVPPDPPDPPRRKPSRLIPYAVVPTDRERFHDEQVKENDRRSPFEIDRSRIIHSAAFRRLQGKTQVFGIMHDAFFRTRLTHSLEVAQIAKGIALRFKRDTDLVEAISLAHDIGHPPFGHAGERALNECLERVHAGHFESNAQNLRLLDQIEMKFLEYPGLNLTRATLDGLLKHKKDAHARRPVAYESEAGLLAWITRGAPPDRLSLETQIVDWADQIAYSVHDFEDGIHAGMITSTRMNDDLLRERIQEFADKRSMVKVVEATLDFLISQVRAIEEHPDALTRGAARKMLTSALINRFIWAPKIPPLHVPPAADASPRYIYELIIAPDEQARVDMMRIITQHLIVNDPRVATLERRSHHTITRIFDELILSKSLFLYPEEFRPLFLEAGEDERARARVASDYISSMTDRYAEMLYQRLFIPGSGNVFDLV